jgi:hypothetical protein
MLPDALSVSGLSPFSFIHPRHTGVALTFHSSQQRVAANAVRSVPPTPQAQARACGAMAGAGASGTQGAKDLAAGALGTEGRGIPAVRAAGTLSPGDLSVLVIGRGRGGRERQGAAPLRGGSLHPLTESRGGGRGASAWGRRGSACHQAVYRRGSARRGGTGARCGGVWERGSGDAGLHHSARRALEEEEAGLLHLEVSNRPSECPSFGAGV